MLLSVKDLNYLVHYVQETSLGGHSLPMSKMKNHSEERIKYEWKSDTIKNDNPIHTVSKATITKYTSMIMSKNVFNIHNSIARKT